MTHQIVVNSMHERKIEMAKRSGAFIGLPGGFGTFEEVCHQLAVPMLTLTGLFRSWKSFPGTNLISIINVSRTLISLFRCRSSRSFHIPRNLLLVNE